MEQITSTLSDFRVIHGAKPDSHGRRLIATFTLHFAGIVITSCVLLMREDGTVRARGPQGRNLANRHIRVNFYSKEARISITNQAAQAYTAMTGIEV